MSDRTPAFPEDPPLEPAVARDPHDFDFMLSSCPSCGAALHPTDLPSGAVVMRCRGCGQTAI